jgi:3-isopropylmalate/(R)-2-methylmalate dehydratase small subunit
MASTPFTVLRSRVVPLPIPNIDTDVIIRVERMMNPDPSLATWAFESIRYDTSGAPKADVALNDPVYAASEILLAGSNFGCGSSREPAVWAVMALGFRCVIAPSFGDIFAANCLTNGVLPVVLQTEALGRLAEGARDLEEVIVDLPRQTVLLGTRSWSFEIGEMHKMMLVEGLDELALALRHRDVVNRWEIRDQHQRVWAWPRKQDAPAVR